MEEITVLYHPLVRRNNIPSLDLILRARVKTAIEEKLATKPEIFGIPLRATLKGYWKLRVGDWRVVFTIKNRIVYIIVIAHRKHVYTIAKKRV
jgi:mRNA interferase RelE/StbE